MGVVNIFVISPLIKNMPRGPWLSHSDEDLDNMLICICSISSYECEKEGLVQMKKLIEPAILGWRGTTHVFKPLMSKMYVPGQSGKTWKVMQSC